MTTITARHPMHFPSSFSQSSKSRRIATLLFAAVLWLAAPLQIAMAGDGLTTSSDSSSTTRTSILKSLFSGSSSTSSSSSSSSQLSRSIFGLPIGILKSAVSGVSKAASNVVTKHISKVN